MRPAGAPRRARSGGARPSGFDGQRVGKRQERERRAARGRQVDRSVPERGELDLDERVDAAFGRRRRVHDHPARLARIVRMIELDARMRGVGAGRDVRERGAALDRAPVLAARDDFLARIAALAEVDAADHVEVDHLRNELLDGRLRDARLARAHVEPIPDGGRHARQRGFERGQARVELGARRDPQVARAARRVGQPHERAGRRVDFRVDAVG
ncbi:glycine cleavage T domain protein [Burkholderia mallei]|nr:glycine cleavage T domain protein [Burkholderia mallei]